MDYGALLRDSWRITWRHKYLWVLGVFAGESGGCGASFNTGDFDPTSYTSEAPLTGWDGLADWIGSHWVLVVALALGAVVLAVVLFVVSMVAKAGLVVGVDDVALRRPDAGLSRAWAGGAGRAVPLLAMHLLVGLAATVAVAAAGAVVAVPVVSWVTTGAEPGTAGILILALLVLVLVVLAIPAAVAVQLVLTWGTRSLVLDHTGTVDSLRIGWRLLRARLGVSLILYLLTTAVGFGIGLVTALVFVVVGLPLVLGMMTAGGVGSLTWVGVGVLAVLLFAFSIVLGGVTGTFFSTYWTLAYRRLFPPQNALMRAHPSGWPQASRGL